MSSVTVIGTQWGDEGKGKIVDWLSERADIIVRFQGGHNAGHTLVIDGETYKLSLLPSGILRKNKLAVIASGVVIDPQALLQEIDALQERGVSISPDNLAIAENASLILPIHRCIERWQEQVLRGGIGTTLRGIGPAYADRAARRALRICDLADKSYLRTRLSELLSHHAPLFAGMAEQPPSLEETLASLEKMAGRILPFAQPVWRLFEGRRHAQILFEGAQGVHLDLDYGTFPYVTSSRTLPGEAACSSGIAARRIGFVLGITKAYTTRVGLGPFPSEQDNDIGERLGKLGNEFGTVTKRKRRCGWFDAVLVRQSGIIAGVEGIALTKMDVLDSFAEIKICVGYRIDGEHWTHLPPHPFLQARIEPIFETMPGWLASTRSARSWADLPAQAIKYVRRIEELIHQPVSLLSTSPEREDVIVVRDPFF